MTLTCEHKGKNAHIVQSAPWTWFPGWAKKGNRRLHHMPACLSVHCICRASCFMYELLCNLHVKALQFGCIFLCILQRQFLPLSYSRLCIDRHWYIFHSVTHSRDVSLSGMKKGNPTTTQPTGLKVYTLRNCSLFSLAEINPYKVTS